MWVQKSATHSKQQQLWTWENWIWYAKPRLVIFNGISVVRVSYRQVAYWMDWRFAFTILQQLGGGEGGISGASTGNQTSVEFQIITAARRCSERPLQVAKENNLPAAKHFIGMSVYHWKMAIARFAILSRHEMNRARLQFWEDWLKMARGEINL